MIWLKIDDILYKKVNNELSDSSKNIFQKTKKLFDLRLEIYKKLVLEKENLKFEKSIGETVRLKNQIDNLSENLNRKNVMIVQSRLKKSKKYKYKLV